MANCRECKKMYIDMHSLQYTYYIINLIKNTRARVIILRQLLPTLLLTSTYIIIILSRLNIVFHFNQKR